MWSDRPWTPVGWPAWKGSGEPGGAEHLGHMEGEVEALAGVEPWVAHGLVGIVELAFEHGLLVMGCGANSMRMIPPLVITRAEMDESLDIFDYCVGLAERESA